jgi:uncharacterized delta-60 repeat protein
MIRSARTRRHTFRPRVDALEERQLLSAGALDTGTFNPPNGFVLTAFTQTSKGTTTTSGEAWAVQVQSDGKTVAAGSAFEDFALTRYNPAATLDSTFGSGGKALTAFNSSLGAQANDLVIQADGKILAAGYSDQQVKGHTPGYDFAVARYNPNGTLDTTFGPNHNGMVTTDFGGTDKAQSVVLQPDGKILVGGWTGDSRYATPTSAANFALARYNSDGTLDSSFGSGGKVITDITPDAHDGSGADEFADFGLDTVNGTTKIVAAGLTDTSAGSREALVRYNPNGSLDSSFGSGGVIILNDTLQFTTSYFDGRLAIQSDQKIVLSGQVPESSSVNDIAAARFNPDGSFDTTFNPGGPWPGIATVRQGNAYTLVIQPGDGKIVLAGRATNDGGVTHHTTLARLNPDGTVDTSFGGGTGYVIQPFSASQDEARGVALQPSDGKIVTAGPVQDQNGSWNHYFCVARFLNDTTTPSAPASAMSLTSTGGPSVPSASQSLSNPVAPSTAVFDQALALAALDPASGLTAGVAPLGDVGLSPARPRVRWSLQAHALGQS